ncbi:MAG: DUF1501 domain-containing protein [Myxococcota bacterium]
MRRRDVLAAGASTAALSLLPKRAFASWGDAPETATDLLLGPGTRAERCLEVYLYGGIPTYHSFYAVPEYGTPNDPDPALQNTQYYQFATDKASVWGGDCGKGSNPAGWLTPFATDALGKTVNFTPMVAALLARPDVLARTRVLVTRHDFGPHEVAIPYMLTGSRLGSPRMAGLGAHVQRYWHDRDTSGRLVPFSYVFSPEGDTLTSAASVVGQHPGSARPLHIQVSTDTDVGTLVGRKYLGNATGKVDALLDHYAKSSDARYADLTGARLRSRGVDDHQFAIASLINAPNLQSVLTPELFVPSSSLTCGFNNVSDVSAMTIDAAVSLLTHPSTPAKYVNVVEGGNTAFGSLSYDLHTTLVDTGTKNLQHVLQRLCDQINEPGEGDPAKLDIEDTLVVITADFGRAPVPQGGGNGSDHFPFGFVSILIGGPVQQGVTGALGKDGYAAEWVQSSEIRAAALAALGIYPFTAQSFAVGDITGAETEADGLAWLNEYVLGRAP